MTDSNGFRVKFDALPKNIRDLSSTDLIRDLETSLAHFWEAMSRKVELKAEIKKQGSH